MVLLTGASGGLGRALAVRLSAEHAKVTVTGRRADVLEELDGSGVGVSLIYPGPISHAGMWADAGAPTPPGVRPRPPEAVANAVVQAIQRNRPEIDVASLTLRLGAALALLRPEWFAFLG